MSLSRAFQLGLLTGVVYFAGSLYWITRVMVLYGGLSAWVAVLVNAALVAYLALFPALFAVIVRRLVAAHGDIAVFTSPLVWVATELGRTHLFTGFPWVLLGYSEVTTVPIAQLASVFGVYGVSALAALVSATAVFIARVRAPRPRLIALAATASLVVATAVWGSVRVARADLVRGGEPITVGLIQGNVDQSVKWDERQSADIFQAYLAMTRDAIARGAQLVIWPESSTPFYFQEDRAAAAMIESLARQAHVPILLGSDQIEHSQPPRYYNSAFLVRSDGTTDGVYRKMHLVPFGEYVPAQRLFFFAGHLVEAVSDFSPGTEAILLPVRGHLISTAICYEIVYPDLVRRFVRGGSELLTTITNDAWFGRTSAPYQHFAQASMRAIEEGRYLVRSANTGISGIVDPYGRTLEETGLYTPAVVIGEARFLRDATVYSRTGDLFAYACVLLTGAVLLMARRRVEY